MKTVRSSTLQHALWLLKQGTSDWILSSGWGLHKSVGAGLDPVRPVGTQRHNWNNLPYGFVFVIFLAMSICNYCLMFLPCSSTVSARIHITNVLFRRNSRMGGIALLLIIIDTRRDPCPHVPGSAPYRGPYFCRRGNIQSSQQSIQFPGQLTLSSSCKEV